MLSRRKWVDMLEGKAPVPELQPLTPEDLQLLAASRRGARHKRRPPAAAGVATRPEE